MNIMDTTSLMETAYKALFNVDVIAMKQLERFLAPEDAVLTSQEKAILYYTTAYQLDVNLAAEYSGEVDLLEKYFFRGNLESLLATFLIMEEFCPPKQLVGFSSTTLTYMKRMLKEYDTTNLEKGLSLMFQMGWTPTASSPETILEELKLSGGRMSVLEAYPRIKGLVAEDSL